MKSYISKCLAIIMGILFITQACKDKLSDKDILPNENKQQNDTLRNVFQKDTIIFVENELIVSFNNPPTTEMRDRIKKIINEELPDITFNTTRACSGCDSYVELWEGENIHTFVQDTLMSGTRGSSKIQGEDAPYFSLNIISRLPLGISNMKFPQLIPSKIETKPKVDEIIVAVLDTGIDHELVNNSFFWKTEDNCYPTGTDDNVSRHGTIVSQYIINQFSDSPFNDIRIMNLKTHNSYGNGTLFDIICAIRYAKRNGANIINASWKLELTRGSHPYLDSLITYELKQAGILFIAAAGNTNINDPNPNRNLDDIHLYPGYLSDASNNVFTITTTDGISISPNQNYSKNHVDFGVKTDTVVLDQMLFHSPFNSPAQYTGSSYATAIATGRIGSFFPKEKYVELPTMDKEKIINTIVESSENSTGSSIILDNKTLLNYIREGRYILK